MKFRHMFLGEVTLADPSLNETVAANIGPETFVSVIDQDGEVATARVRNLEVIEEVVIPESQRSLNTLGDEILAINRSKGWTPPEGEETNLDRNLMLIVGEIAEAQEELRHHHGVYEVYYNKPKPPSSLVAEVGVVEAERLYSEHNKGYKPGPQGFGIEIADVIIRTLGLCAELGLDIDALVRDKMEYNKTRSYKHGNKAF